MKINAFTKKNSVFFTWLLSYVSILLIPVFISSVVYVQAGRIVQNEVNRANAALLKQVQQVMDSQMNDIEKLSLQIALNANIQGLLYAEEPLQSFHNYTITRAIQDFKVYKIANGFIDDFHVYFKKFDSIMTPETFYKAGQLYENIHRNEGIDYLQWKKLVQEPHVKDYALVTGTRKDGTTMGKIVFAQSLPMQDHARSSATLIIQLDEKRFQDAVKNLQWADQGVVFIIDKNNDVLASTESTVLPSFLNYDNLNADGVMYERVNGQEMAVSYIKSQNAEWKYVSVLPASLFSEKVEYIRRLTFVSILLCLLVGGPLVYFFAAKNYSPMYELVQALANKAGISLDKGDNEYRFIQEAISQTISEKDKIFEKLKQQNVVLRSNLLVKLLKGKMNDSMPIHEALSSYDLEFISSNFAVILVYFEDYSKLFSEEQTLYAGEKLKLVHFIAGNVIEELTGQKNHRSFMAEVDEMMACLVNVNEANLAQGDEELLEIVQEMQQFLMEKFQIYITASISSIHQTFAGISTAYQEAMEAMEYKLIYERGKIIQYNEIKASRHTGGNNYHYSLETEQQLINHIKVGDAEKAGEILDNVFHDSFSKDLLSIQMAKCLMFDLVSTMLKTIDEINIDFKSDFIEGLNPVERLLNCETVKQMKIQMKDILGSVCEYINVNKKSRNHTLRDNIAKFIEENYQDEDLSLSMIAEAFEINLSYLSSFFKEQNGEGLLDFINKFRLQKAKELLREQNFSIGETAKKVGYSNSNALIRNFKKYEGITPGQYREMV